jgi:hypothetical protein
MWSHEFYLGNRAQAALWGLDGHPTPPVAPALRAAATAGPRKEHHRAWPDGDALLQHGVLAAIVELNRRIPPEPPLLRADAWCDAQVHARAPVVSELKAASLESKLKNNFKPNEFHFNPLMYIFLLAGK